MLSDILAELLIPMEQVILDHTRESILHGTGSRADRFAVAEDLSDQIGAIAGGFPPDSLVD